MKQTAILLSAGLVLSTLPAVAAPQCRATYQGKTFIDWLPCNITTEKGSIVFEQGNFFTAKVVGGALKSNVANFGGPKERRYKLDDFGKYKEKQIDGGICYVAAKLEVCSGDSED